MFNQRNFRSGPGVGDELYQLAYTAYPTVSTFMQDPSFTRFLLGPVGSGKTTGVLFELLRRCIEQAPGPDGIRRTRWAIVRSTLSQLKMTVLRDIEQWLRPITTFRVSDNTVILQVGDVYSEWFLIPLNEPEDQKRLLSMQLTGIWINEFIELVPDLVPAMAGRVGRFPSANQGGPSWFGIIGDSNMPNIGGDWHRLLDYEKPEDWGVFFQPGGLEPNAENLDYLVQTAQSLLFPPGSQERLDQGREYYHRLARQHSKAWVKRYVDAKFGDDPDGTAVFKDTFVTGQHVIPGTITKKTYDKDGFLMGIEVAGGLTPTPGRMLIVGQDFGRNPCSIICQLDHLGRLLVLEEVVGLDTGLELHVKTKLRPKLLDPRYQGMPVIIVGDPSGAARNTLTEETCFDLLKREGFAAQPAPTNDLDPRIRAVDTLLISNPGGRQALLIDGARCPTLVRALAGSYRYGKTKAGESKPKPEKTNPWSDLADALQYAALMVHPNALRVAARSLARQTGSRAPAQPAFSASAWT